jgi:hypothetical protein
MGVCGERYTPASLDPEMTWYPCMGARVGSRAIVDGCEKSRPTGIQGQEHPVRSE